jgi:hypothetical protein
MLARHLPIFWGRVLPRKGFVLRVVELMGYLRALGQESWQVLYSFGQPKEQCFFRTMVCEGGA